MRGKGLVDCAAVIIVGITPAYAGKSFAEWIDEQGEEDHPRLCGEKGAFSPFGSSDKGSPPPMRGKVHTSSGIFEFRGITPAYAGKRYFRGSALDSERDHPRLCGEKPERCICPHSLVGSPPPMRGKVLYTICNYKWCRITPAYAGKSSTILFFTNCL